MLIATNPAVCTALRARVQEIDRIADDAGAAVLTRQNDLSRALENFDETTDTESLTAAIAALAMEIGELQQRTGALSEALLRDDEARRAASTLSGEIITARTELEIWQAVDDAVGSASGDRFRRFVQCIIVFHCRSPSLRGHMRLASYVPGELIPLPLSGSIPELPYVAKVEWHRNLPKVDF